MTRPVRRLGDTSRAYKCPTCGQALSKAKLDAILHIEEARDRELIALRTSLKNERDKLHVRKTF